MRVLLIEDDSRIARFIKRGLEAERYLVDIAADGKQGVELGRTGVHDLIILDIMLPELSGIQVCEQLRSLHVHTPILMLTARDSVEDKVEGLGVGADDYLTKPFAFEELLARIRALLRRRPEMDLAPVLRVADLVLDKGTREVRRGGKPIELTVKEFALLEHLMQHANRVLSRPMIEEKVWGYQKDPLTNVVDVYIRRLRQKIDHGHSLQLIHTVRGVGYVLRG